MDDRARHYRQASESAARAARAAIMDDPEARRRCLRFSQQLAKLADRIERRSATVVVPINVPR
jgi:hypothetical protein